MNDRERAAIEAVCGTCKGHQVVIAFDVRQECCGDLTYHGECRGSCYVFLDIEVETPCPDCNGTGKEPAR